MNSDDCTEEECLKTEMRVNEGMEEMCDQVLSRVQFIAVSDVGSIVLENVY